jgi:uncharacterized membrane protein
MTAFGLFWFGEGVGIDWPYADAAILGLICVLFGAATLAIKLCRSIGAVQTMKEVTS